MSEQSPSEQAKPFQASSDQDTSTQVDSSFDAVKDHDNSLSTDTIDGTASNISSEASMAATLSSASSTYRSGGSTMQPGSFRLPPIAALSGWEENDDAAGHSRDNLGPQPDASQHARLGNNRAWGDDRPRIARRFSEFDRFEEHHRQQSAASLTRRAPLSLELNEYRTDNPTFSSSAKMSFAPGTAGTSSGSDGKTPFTPSTGVPNRADNFMASLMRAAQPAPLGSDQSTSRPQSPMSVQSMVERRGAGEEGDRKDERQGLISSAAVREGTSGPRTRKRRTSSVQEPLQGSALEGAERGKAYPRYSGPGHDEGVRSFYAPQTPVRQGLSASSSPMVSPSESFHSSGGSRAVFETLRSHGQPMTFSRSHQQPSQLISPLRSAAHASMPLQSSWPASAGLPSAPYTSRYPDRSASVGPHRQVGSAGSHQGRLASITSGRLSTTESSLEATLSAAHWNADIAAQAIAEEERWARTTTAQRRQIVSQSIWDARNYLRGDLAYWPPQQSNITTIRCMYANIAQKSYGSEKRFLCPPPTVKISGPLRPCRWASIRVVSGESPSPTMPYTAVMGSQSSNASAAASTGGEESAVIDAHGEARFGKLHVGGSSDAVNKVFRLQVNLLRADMDARRISSGGTMLPPSPASHGAAPTAWSTLHTAPINVISKPARKSVRTRAASPAIASGSIVCLYNRLNSQTVRTKYLGVEVSTNDAGNADQASISRRLLARQEGWEGFSIELLARPLNDPAVARANSRGLPSDDWGITYGSVVCLRDVNTKLCSDPLLICKVDKGRVELSSIVGTGDETKVRFQIVHRNREEANSILFGGARRYAGTSSSSAATTPALSQDSFPTHSRVTTREESDGGSENGSEPSATGSIGDVNSSVGGPVIQMQKITLMNISPTPCSGLPEEFECDLSLPRSYLSSTASENARENPSRPAIVRSMVRLRTRAAGFLRGEPNAVSEEPSYNAQSPTESGDSAPWPALAAAVGYARPPLITSPTAKGRNGQADALEDQFCWTIVTISCTEASYIEANAISRGKYPHLASTPLPITPFPTFASQAMYDPRSHSIGATVLDFLYAEGLDADAPAGSIDTLSASQPGGIKVAHEIWLGHNCALPTHATSAGPHMSDVMFRLPAMDTLLELNDVLQRDDQHKGENHAEDSRQTSHQAHTAGIIRVPILFVRVSQGISFPSGCWLIAERLQGGAHSYRSMLDPLAWTFRVG